jgi:tRNA-Thr(GGU) m(6)t(6)A37 methyltransferase TsaA
MTGKAGQTYTRVENGAYCMEPIGFMQTCFKEKFGIPRQPGLVTGAEGTIKLRNDPFLLNAIKGLEGFSHLWVIFVFHEQDARSWKPSIRPPRLGGAKKVGVLASRSPHRPNPIGLSVVKIDKINTDASDGIEIQVSGVDVLDGTPVLDIKPYIAYADAIEGTTSGWADSPIPRTEVELTPEAESDIQARDPDGKKGLKALVIEMLSLDPRPAFQQRRMPPTHPEAQGSRYGFLLLDYDVKWEIRDGKFRVLNLVG